MSVTIKSTWALRAVQYLSIEIRVLGLIAVSLAAGASWAVDISRAGGGVREAILAALETGFLSRMALVPWTWCLRDVAVLRLMNLTAGLPLSICLLADAGGGASDAIFSALDSSGIVVLVALAPRTWWLHDLAVLGLMDGDLQGARDATRSALVSVAAREVRWRRRLRTCRWQDWAVLSPGR